MSDGVVQRFSVHLLLFIRAGRRTASCIGTAQGRGGGGELLVPAVDRWGRSLRVTVHRGALVQLGSRRFTDL